MSDIQSDDSSRRGSEDLLDSFFAEAALGLSVTDLNGRFLKVNPAFCAMTGHTEAELKELNFRNLTHPDDFWSTQEKIAALLSGEESSIQIEDRCIRKDTAVIWLLHTISIIRGQNGQPAKLIRVSEDITGRKGLEAALRQSEERYRELFDNARDAIYVHDLGGRYTSFNRAAERLSGYSRDEILGKHFSNFVAPGSLKDARQNLVRKLDQVDETTYEIDLITKDRRRVPIEVSSRLIYENGEPVGVQGVARDITDRRRAQEALQAYARPLIQAQEAERQLIARELQDEIGQVLTTVRLNLQALQLSAPAGSQPPPVDESLAMVDEALERVRELSLTLRPEMLDELGLGSALRWYVDRYARRSRIAAELTSDLEDGCRLREELEAACFRIVEEALANVARHARATHVLVRLKRVNGSLDLRITDNGIGFDVNEVLRSPTLTAALGLRGMEEHAAAAQGHLKIDSAPMRGTEVQAMFPLVVEGQLQTA